MKAFAEPYYAASNHTARLRDIAQSMTRGVCGESKVTILRGREPLTLTVNKAPYSKNGFSLGAHDLPGPTFQLLSKDVAYLKLSPVKITEAEHYIHDAAGTKGLIIDIRNYPSEFVVFALGSLLAKTDVPFARFTQLDLANPGAFTGLFQKLGRQNHHTTAGKSSFSWMMFL